MMENVVNAINPAKLVHLCPPPTAKLVYTLIPSSPLMKLASVSVVRISIASCVINLNQKYALNV